MKESNRDHKYCTVCRECITCNLRPCRDGGPHTLSASLKSMKNQNSKKHILSIVIEHKFDESPDTSYLGKYTDEAADWNICRCCGEYLKLCDKEHEIPSRGREFRFFTPEAGGEEAGTKEYQQYGKRIPGRLPGRRPGRRPGRPNLMN